jgi:predicted enzyme related to lactoylglutathione lyase
VGQYTCRNYPKYWIVITSPNNWSDNKSIRTRTIEVPDVEGYLKKIQQARGTVVLPKTTIPRAGYLAYFTDSQDNIFGTMKNNHNAT